MFDKYNSLIELVKSEFASINPLLEDFGEMQKDFSEWVKFWMRRLKPLVGSWKVGKGIAWDVAKNIIQNSLKIISCRDDAARIGPAICGPVFKGLGNVGRGFHIAGGVIGVPFYGF